MKYKLISILLKIIFVVFAYQNWDKDYFWFVAVVIFLLWSGVSALGSIFPRLNLYINSQSSFDGKGVVLTFDDGPHETLTPQVLDVLKDKEVKAVFFLIGKNARKYPEIVKRIHQEGHLIGLHSESHKWYLPFLPYFLLKKDFKKNAQIIEELIGQKPVVIRPPFGVTSPPYEKLVRKQKYKSLTWNLRSFDTEMNTPNELLTAIDKKINLEKDNLILLHDNCPNTIGSLDRLIDSVRVEQCREPKEVLKIDFYESI